jgi:hypothetical protein
MSELVATFQKDPSEVLDYTLDWSTALAGDTISGTNSTWVTPSGLTQVVSPAPSNTTTTTTVWLSGGTSPTDYAVENTIVTTGGRTIQAHMLIQVR